MIQQQNTISTDSQVRHDSPATLFKAVLAKWFRIEDWHAIDIVTACAIAHYVPGEPLWLRFIGASRSGKTELLSSFVGHKDVAEMEYLTPASIRGGYKDGPNIVERIKGKLVITKDLAAMLTTRKDLRNEVFGLLRNLKDGRLTADFGSDAGHVSIEGRFDWLLNVTHIIEQQRQLESLLGERFVDLRWQAGAPVEGAIQAQENSPHLQEIRKELAEAGGRLLDFAKTEAPSYKGDLDTRWIANLANCVAQARTPVMRDRFKNIVGIPTPEYPTSLAQDFSRIAKGLTLVGVQDYRPYLVRLGWDCIPMRRAKVLEQLFDGATSLSELAIRLYLPQPTVEYELEDLQALHIIARTGHTWTANWTGLCPP